MKTNLIFAFILLLGFVGLYLGRADSTAKDEAFLDLPMSQGATIEMVRVPSQSGDPLFVMSPMIKVPSFWQGVQVLGQLSGKKVLLPKGIGEWPEEKSERNWEGMALGFAPKASVRDTFERLCMSLRMSWHFDVTDDAILLEPQWKRDDPRPAKDLMTELVAMRPVPWTQLPFSQTPNRVGGHDLELDSWRLAFDGLLSKPENFSSAGTLRVYHDTHGHTGLSNLPVINLLAAKMVDAGGVPEIVVLNSQERMTNKDNPGDLAYYIFDEGGRFLAGGVYAMADGREGEIEGAKAESDHGITIDMGWGSFGLNPGHFHFTMQGGNLVLQGSTDAHGMQRSADDTRNRFPPPFGPIAVLKFSVSASSDP